MIVECQLMSNQAFHLLTHFLIPTRTANKTLLHNILSCSTKAFDGITYYLIVKIDFLIIILLTKNSLLIRFHANILLMKFLMKLKFSLH